MKYRLIVHMGEVEGEEVNTLAAELNRRGYGVTVYEHEVLTKQVEVERIQYALLPPVNRNVVGEGGDS